MNMTIDEIRTTQRLARAARKAMQRARVWLDEQYPDEHYHTTDLSNDEVCDQISYLLTHKENKPCAKQ